jgi:AraC-like DNA-binding protein
VSAWNHQAGCKQSKYESVNSISSLLRIFAAVKSAHAFTTKSRSHRKMKLNNVQYSQEPDGVLCDVPPILDLDERQAVNGNDMKPTCGAKSTRKIDWIIAYMAQHLDQSLEVAALASQVNLSLPYFYTLFKRQTGRTPINFFNQMRIQRACELLESSSSSVKEVAMTLGYKDPLYFSRVFRSVTNVPPSQYRVTQPRFILDPRGRSLSINVQSENLVE